MNQAFCEKHKLLLIAVLIRDKLKKSGRLKGISITSPGFAILFESDRGKL